MRLLWPLTLDALLIEQCDRSVDVMFLCDTWYDADFVSIRRLHFDGFGVIERARTRSCHAAASLGVNLGGVAIVTAAGIRLKAVDIGILPTTFECVTGRIASG